jgi:hypothetical protein
MADFKTWTHESLVKFAEQANVKMREQHEYNEQLQRLLKDAQAASRTPLSVLPDMYDLPQSKAP